MFAYYVCAVYIYYVYMCVYIYVCVYVYIYKYINTHTRVYLKKNLC